MNWYSGKPLTRSNTDYTSTCTYYCEVLSPTDEVFTDYEYEGPIQIGGWDPEPVEKPIKVERSIEKSLSCAKIEPQRKRIVAPPGGWGFYRG